MGGTTRRKAKLPGRDVRAPSAAERRPRKAGAGPAAKTSPAPSETRERILRAALEAFAEGGFAGTRTADIAARAGLAEKTLFAHFSGKEELYHTTLGAAAADVLVPASLEAILPALAPPYPSLPLFLRRVLENRLTFARAHRAKLKLAVQEVLLRPELIERHILGFEGQIRPHLIDALETFRARGELRDIPPAAAFRAVVSLFGGYVLLRTVLAPHAPWNDEAEIRATVDILLGGIGHEKADVSRRAQGPRQGASGPRRRR